MSKWNEPSQLRVSGSDFVPVCQCCLSTVDLVETQTGMGNLSMWLCPVCEGAHYKTTPRKGSYPFGNAIVSWLVCPVHGEQWPIDIVEESYDFVKSKRGHHYPVKGKLGNKLWGFCQYEEK